MESGVNRVVFPVKEFRLRLADREMDCITFGSGDRPMVVIQGLSTRGIKGAGLLFALMYRIFAAGHTVYLFDRRTVLREGVTVRELAAVLFEDDAYSNKQMLYLQKIISSMMQTLKAYNATEVVHKSYNAIGLHDEMIDCDYYRFLNMEAPSINAYCGEFMTQYSWAEFVAGYLDRISGDRTEGTP